jgi:Tfp pilus assembly protein PilF
MIARMRLSEYLMRFTTLAVAAALMLVSVSTALMAQRSDAPIDARSLALLQQGKAARAAGNLDGAQDLLESALAVDPRNREAFVVMAEIARTRGLPGKAIRLYGEALALRADDPATLRGQGEALVAKGAIGRANENLTKIRAVCGKDCGDATLLAAIIAKGPPTATAQAEAAPAPTATPAAQP